MTSRALRPPRSRAGQTTYHHWSTLGGIRKTGRLSTSETAAVTTTTAPRLPRPIIHLVTLTPTTTGRCFPFTDF